MSLTGEVSLPSLSVAATTKPTGGPVGPQGPQGPVGPPAEIPAALTPTTVTIAGRGDIFLNGSAAGGDETYDSTPRITGQSRQKWGYSSGHLGELARFDAMTDDSKAVVAFRIPTAFNPDGSPIGNPLTAFALVIHKKAHDVGQPDHNHFSFETVKPDNTVHTRMEFPYVDPLTGLWGMEVQLIRITSSNFMVSTDSSFLTMGGSAGTSRMITFATGRDGADTARRWSVGANGTAESGTNAGSNFDFQPRSDTGNNLNIALRIMRSNGIIGVNILTPGARLDVVEGGSRPTGRFEQTTATGGNAYAAVSAYNGNSANKAFDINVIGETTARWAVLGRGELQIGDGTNARDTNLYRKAANQLATDDAFFMGNVSAPATPTAGAILYVESGSLKVKGSSGTVTVLGPA